MNLFFSMNKKSEAAMLKQKSDFSYTTFFKTT